MGTGPSELLTWADQTLITSLSHYRRDEIDSIEVKSQFNGEFSSITASSTGVRTKFGGRQNSCLAVFEFCARWWVCNGVTFQRPSLGKQVLGNIKTIGLDVDCWNITWPSHIKPSSAMAYILRTWSMMVKVTQNDLLLWCLHFLVWCDDTLHCCQLKTGKNHSMPCHLPSCLELNIAWCDVLPRHQSTCHQSKTFFFSIVMNLCHSSEPPIGGGGEPISSPILTSAKRHKGNWDKLTLI